MIDKKAVKKMVKEKNYKGFVGPKNLYEKIGENAFQILLKNGLKKHHYICDIGCGSLRLGKRLIPNQYINRYYGIEPNKWLVEEALKNEISEEIINKKNPKILFNRTFGLNKFNEKFDFIIANSIFMHACKWQIEKCIDEVILTLKDNGIFIFNFIKSKNGKDNLAKEWTYPSSIKYRKEYFEELLKNKNLKYKYLDTSFPGYQTYMKVQKC